MLDYDALLTTGKPAAGAVSAHLRARLQAFVAPLLAKLDQQIDARLVRTFGATLEVLLLFRHRQYGLLLSELGAYLLSPDRAPAGTKRLSNLLRCRKWDATLIAAFLWQQAEARGRELRAAGEEALLLWDESVLEKPESRQAEGLCPVRSSKARRLTRPKPGCFRKPGPPVVVPGLHWLALLLVGPSGPPTVAAMRWFSLPRRAKKDPPAPAPQEDPAPTATSQPADAPPADAPPAEARPAYCAPDLRTLQAEVLAECVRRWGRQVLHVWDRGYAGSPWLGVVLPQAVRFVLRWPKGYHLQDRQGSKRPAWQIARGKRSWGHRYLWDPHARQYRKVGVLALPVQHPEYDVPLWLVVARCRGRHEPWYLLTTEAIHTEADAWKVVRAYARRWQIELTFRYTKSELALESPRLWKWANREKLLLMVTVAYAFLLQLLVRPLAALRQWLLRYFCHRTGTRSRAAAAPLHRLRAALSRLWLAFPATPLPAQENPG
jgi:hypothetical protein